MLRVSRSLSSGLVIGFTQPMYEIREGQAQDACVRAVNGTLGENVNLRVGIQASEISKSFVCKHQHEVNTVIGQPK